MFRNNIFRAILLLLVVVVEYPFIVPVDNVEYKLLLDNTLVSQWMKYIYVHHYFICNYVESGTVKIQFFHSEKILADPFSNKLSIGMF